MHIMHSTCDLQCKTREAKCLLTDISDNLQTFVHLSRLHGRLLIGSLFKFWSVVPVSRDRVVSYCLLNFNSIYAAEVYAIYRDVYFIWHQFLNCLLACAYSFLLYDEECHTFHLHGIFFDILGGEHCGMSDVMPFLNGIVLSKSV